MERLGYAFSGLILLIRTERHFQIHWIALALAILMGCYFNLTSLEWMILLSISGLVLVSEAINTSIEKLSDVFTKEQNLQIKQIKDIAAGAVLLAAILALIVGILLFYPHIEKLFH